MTQQTKDSLMEHGMVFVLGMLFWAGLILFSVTGYRIAEIVRRWVL